MLEIFIILSLIIINGVFSMSEIALVSVKRSRLEIASKKGDKNAEVALKLSKSPDRFLSTVQIGITLIGILTGVYSGENIVENLKAFLNQSEFLRPYSQGLAVTIIVILMTFFSLVIGELVPKRIGLANPEKIAKRMAKPMNFLSKIVAPFIWLLTVSGSLLLKLFRFKPDADQGITEEEIKALVQEGAHAGVIRQVESNIVDRVFHIGDRKAATLMTTRQEIEWLNVHDPVTENLQKIVMCKHNVYPLCDNDLDHVVGAIYIKDVLKILNDGETPDLNKIKRKVIFIPELSNAYRVLERFREARVHYAMVVDEYGGISGVICMDDILEVLVGDIPEEDDVDYQIKKRKDGTYLIDGMLPVEDFLSYFVIPVDHSEYAGINTLAGIAMYYLKKVPKAGDTFEWLNFKFEIMDMDRNRVDKVLVTKKN